MVKRRIKQKRRRFSSESTRRRVEERNKKTRSVYEIPDDFQMMQIKKAGTYRLDILPYVVEIPTDYAEEGDLHWERTIEVHYNVGPNQVPRLCPRTVGERCPICEKVDKMRRDPEVDDDEIRSLQAKERQLFYVMDVRNPDNGIQILETAYFNFGKAIDRRVFQLQEDEDEDSEEKMNFADPENGMTVKALFEAASFGGNSFLKCDTVDFIRRKTQYTVDICEELPSLDSLLIVPEYDALKAEMEGESESKKTKK